MADFNPYTVSDHAFDRLYERSSVRAIELVRLLGESKFIRLTGTSRGCTAALFYSKYDESFLVALIGTNYRVITVITDDIAVSMGFRIPHKGKEKLMKKLGLRSPFEWTKCCQVKRGKRGSKRSKKWMDSYKRSRGYLEEEELES